jgi:hypothetical protein
MFRALLIIVVLSLTASSQAKEPPMSVIRISRGTFAAADHDKVKEKLAAAEKSLAPELAKLRGLRRYHVAIDRVSSTMVNVSVWDSLDAAKQMDALPAMAALASDFIAMGVKFERPIINLDMLWTVDPATR